jgi:hypothetical protein
LSNEFAGGDTREVDVGDDGKEAEGDELKVQADENSDPWMGLFKPVWVIATHGWLWPDPRGSRPRPTLVNTTHNLGLLRPTWVTAKTSMGHSRDPPRSLQSIVGSDHNASMLLPKLSYKPFNIVPNWSLSSKW